MTKSYEIWVMPNKCKVIVWKRSKKNMLKILKWFVERKKLKGKSETFNFDEISRNVGINHKQVAYCCRLLAFKKNPYLHITVGECINKKSKELVNKPFCKVKLIKSPFKSSHAGA